MSELVDFEIMPKVAIHDLDVLVEWALGLTRKAKFSFHEDRTCRIEYKVELRTLGLLQDTLFTKYSEFLCSLVDSTRSFLDCKL